MKNKIMLGWLKLMSVIILFIIGERFSNANITLASPFQDHMVLQQGQTVPIWGTASPHEKVKVSFGKQNQTTITGLDGKWKINLTSLTAGGPYEITFKGENMLVLKDVYIGEVWLCSGQSNMAMTVAREDRYWCGVVNEKEEVAAAKYPQIRIFTADYTPRDEPRSSVNGKWEVVSPETVGHLSATAYFFARELYNTQKVPIGLLIPTYGASTAEAWISQPALESQPALTYLLENYAKKKAAYQPSPEALLKLSAEMEKWKIDAAKAKAEGKDEVKTPKNPDPRIDQHNPCVLFNGMLAPFIPYAIRGAIWYQGESNGNSTAVYQQLMETLIGDWRQRWGQGEFPFLYVQLANHQQLASEPVKNDPMVLIREAQLKNLSVANTGMVVAIDNADPDNPGNIHPKNKQSIGKRLSLIARAKVYGENIAYSGPIFDKMQIDGRNIVLSFQHSDGGLVFKQDSINGFAIAGSDKVFVHAQAIIRGNQIIISNPAVENPIAVRYGWAKNPHANLFNNVGFPASPFRTDNW